MKFDTLFLKCTIFILATPVLALCITLPMIAVDGFERFPEYLALLILILVGAYIAAGAYFFVLLQAFKLLVYIDGEKAFSNLSLLALKKIRIGAITISVFFILIMPLIYLAAEYDDAPGLIIVGMAFAFVPIIIAFFSSVLQKLLKSAITLIVENDLIV